MVNGLPISFPFSALAFAKNSPWSLQMYALSAAFMLSLWHCKPSYLLAFLTALHCQTGRSRLFICGVLQPSQIITSVQNRDLGIRTLATKQLLHKTQDGDVSQLTMSASGAGNISDVGKPTGDRRDEIQIPDEAVRASQDQEYHTGRGGAGNEFTAVDHEKKAAAKARQEGAPMGIADKLKNKLFGGMKK